MNSLFLALTNTKSDVIVSCEFNLNILPLLSPTESETCKNNFCGLLPAVVAVWLVALLIPPPSSVPVEPGDELSSKAAAFNNIVEISGRNKP